jgi:glutathione S-transferase
MDFTGELVLHGSGTSPFVRKVRVALIELGIPHVFAPAARSAFWMARQRDKIVSGIDALEQSLTRWSATDLPNCIAPIAVRSALGFVSFWQPELDWAGQAPKLCALCCDLDARPAWAQTVPKLPAGASFPSL